MSISVIVATYGDEIWPNLAIERAIPSADGQGALEIVFDHQPGGSVDSTRNVSAFAASGDWLCFLDADDELAPGYIAAMKKAMAQKPAKWTLFTPAVQIVRRGRGVSSPTFFKECDLRDANWIVIGTLIHKDLFWEVGGFDNHPHGFEDWALWSKCARAGATVVKVPDAVYRYWANPQSKHREGWRNKQWQRSTHDRVRRELDQWEADRYGYRIAEPGA